MNLTQIIKEFFDGTRSISKLRMGEGGNVQTGTATGTQVGTAASEKLGFWGATPVVQPAGADQDEVTLVSDPTAIGNLTVSNPPTQAEVEAIRDALQDVASDLANVADLVHALRTAGVDIGTLKGGA